MPKSDASSSFDATTGPAIGPGAAAARQPLPGAVGGTVHPEGKTLAAVLGACEAAVRAGRPWANGHAEGGFTVVCRRIQPWGKGQGAGSELVRRPPKESIRTSVWQDSKLLRKEQWSAAGSALRSYTLL